MSLSLLLRSTSVGTGMHSSFKRTVQEPIVQMLSRINCTFAESRLSHSQRSPQTRHPTPWERVRGRPFRNVSVEDPLPGNVSVEDPLGTCPWKTPEIVSVGQTVGTCPRNTPCKRVRWTPPGNVFVGQVLGTCRRNTPWKRVRWTPPGNVFVGHPLMMFL